MISGRRWSTAAVLQKGGEHGVQSVRLAYLVAIIQDGNRVALGQQRPGQMQAQECMSASLGVDDQHRVGARCARGMARSGHPPPLRDVRAKKGSLLKVGTLGQHPSVRECLDEQSKVTDLARMISYDLRRAINSRMRGPRDANHN